MILFLKVEQKYLDFGIFGGELYWMQESLYVGGIARFDIYNTIGKDDIINIDVDAPVNIDILNITTDGWKPLSLFFVTGTKL